MHNWGVGPLLWFQGFSPWLDVPFKLLTFLGNREFFILFFPFIYWCVDRGLGKRLAILFLIMMPRTTSWLHGKRTRQYALAVAGPALMLTVSPPAGNGVMPAATLMGMSLGFVLERQTVRFECNGGWIKRIARYVLGMGVSDLVLSGGGPQTVSLFLTYGLMGFWIGFGAPWVFVRLRLLNPDPGGDFKVK